MGEGQSIKAQNAEVIQTGQGRRLHTVRDKGLMRRHLLVFFFCMVQVIIYLLPYRYFSDYVASMYVRSYEYGFFSRGLFGDVLLSFSPYLDSRGIFWFKLVVFIVFYFVVSYALVKCCSYLQDKDFSIFFIVLCLAMPGSFSFPNDFLRPDLFVVTFAALSVFTCLKGRGLEYIPLMCALAILIHEGFVFQYLPIIMSCLLWEAFTQKRTRYYVAAGATLMVAFATALAVAVIGKVPFMDVEVQSNHFQQHTQARTHYMAYYVEVAGLSFSKNQMRDFVYLNWLDILIWIICFLPLAFLLYKTWKYISQIIWEKYPGRMQRAAFILILLSCLSGFFLCIMALDYARWTSAVLWANMMGLCYFIVRDRDVGNGLSMAIYTWRGKQLSMYIPYAICLLYLLLGPLGDVLEAYPVVSHLREIVLMVAHWFGGVPE